MTSSFVNAMFALFRKVHVCFFWLSRMCLLNCTYG